MMKRVAHAMQLVHSKPASVPRVLFGPILESVDLQLNQLLILIFLPGFIRGISTLRLGARHLPLR